MKVTIRGTVHDVPDVVSDELARLEQWVDDLQSGMWVNCVYCGHRYGPDPGTPTSMADVLKAHVETCPLHPMAAAKRRLAEATRVIGALVGSGDPKELRAMLHELRSLRSAPAPRSDMVAAIDAVEFLLAGSEGGGA